MLWIEAIEEVNPICGCSPGTVTSAIKRLLKYMYVSIFISSPMVEHERLISGLTKLLKNY